jgi:glycosyltransferase involved in cell wall biosynthesis
MKIAFILSSCAKSGPFIVARDIVNNLYDKVEELDIFYIKESDSKLAFKAECTNVKLFQMTDFSKYDIVHSHGFLGDIYLHLNRKSIKGKSVNTLHQKIRLDYAMNYNKLISYSLEKLWFACIRKNDSIVALTSEMAQYYSSLMSREIKFVYNGISVKVSGDINGDENTIEKFIKQRKILGISANLIYRKGIDRVIKALAHEKMSDYALLIIGSGKQHDELLKLTEDLGVQNKCLFLGYRENAIEYFKYFDFYIMASRSEGFGLCVIEAASQKVPLICNDLPVFRELFDNEIVRFVDDDLDSLVDAILLADRQKETLGLAGYEIYLQKYTDTIMAKKYFDLYQSLIKNDIT